VTVDMARKVADAVLWEGYVLYPYRKSDGKNVVRWQFGVLMPRMLARLTSEPWLQQTECLVEGAGDAEGVETGTAATTVDITLRFLQVQARIVEAVDREAPGGFAPVERLEVDGAEHMSWDEAVEREVTYSGIALEALLDGERELPIGIPAGRDVEQIRDAAGTVVGRFVRQRWGLFGIVRVSAQRSGRWIRLRITTENQTEATEPRDRGGFGAADRAGALRRSLVGAHTLLSVRDGAFVSVIDPPAEAAEAAQGCVNLNTWPVLVGEAGERSVMLSSPIILYDYPQIAPESAGDLFDATEIDEILLLRVLTLTDEEKAEARATDARARAIIDRADNMPPEVFEKLHGAIRYLKKTPERAGDDVDGDDEDEIAPAAEAAIEEAGAGHVALSGAGLRMGWGSRGSSPDSPPSDDVRGQAVGRGSSPVFPPSDSGEGSSFELPPIVTPEVPEDVAGGVPVFREPGEPPESGQPEKAQPLVYASQAQGIDLESAFQEFFGEPSQGPPDIGTVRIGECDVGKGSRVRISPKRRADAHDVFLKGRHGKVAGVFEDVDGQIYVAVTLEDDPSGELNEWYGRYYYFDSTEVEPLDG
jgi:hypothetical protein